LSKLRITEIFFSLQGESKSVGCPTAFIRLTGCPLRCQYCDTAYAFSGGQLMSLDEIIEKVMCYKTKFVTVTGGEPLAQVACYSLLEILCDKEYIVSLETSGAIDIKDVDPRVIKVLDIKTPGSNESDKNIITNLNYLSKQDQVKFVICNRQDFDWSKEFIKMHLDQTEAEILFSPSYQQLENKELADWILADMLNVRFQMQIHKYIWGDVPGK